MSFTGASLDLEGPGPGRQNATGINSRSSPVRSQEEPSTKAIFTTCMGTIKPKKKIGFTENLASAPATTNNS